MNIVEYFDFVFGDPAHSFNNFCVDILRLEGPMVPLKNSVFIVKTINKKNLIHRLYDRQCLSLLGRSVGLTVFSKTRWSSANKMWKKLDASRQVTATMPALVMSDQSCADVELPDAFVDLVSRAPTWKGIKAMHFVFDPICKCIRVLESQEAPISNVYAFFVYTRLHVFSLSASLKADIGLDDDMV